MNIRSRYAKSPSAAVKIEPGRERDMVAVSHGVQRPGCGIYAVLRHRTNTCFSLGGRILQNQRASLLYSLKLESDAHRGWLALPIIWQQTASPNLLPICCQFLIRKRSFSCGSGGCSAATSNLVVHRPMIDSQRLVRRPDSSDAVRLRVPSDKHSAIPS